MSSKKSKSFLAKSYQRFFDLLDGKMNKKDIDNQFTFLMSGELFRKSFLKKNKKFEPIKMSKMTRKFIRSGRLA